MKATILDGTENENQIALTLKSFLEERDNEVSLFKLKEMDILHCRSCGSCGIRTPGKCVLTDEMPQIMRAMANCNLQVFVTPIRFGGYSSHLKKAVDRMMSLGLPFYMVKGGHLLHPMRYGKKFLLGIGLKENESIEEEKNFRLLISRNALNMQNPYQTIIIRPSDSLDTLKKDITPFLEKVKQR